ncbi:MAG: hypothetical protein ACR2P1_21940 [Pseudomonadales bacterium]
MTTLVNTVVAALFTVLLVTLPMTVSAADPKPVLEVAYFDANGDIPGFVTMMAKVHGMVREIHPKSKAKVRIFMLDAAGKDTGTVAVVVEHPSYSEWGKAREIINPDPRWAELLKEFQAAGYKLLYRGLSVEIGRFD